MGSSRTAPLASLALAFVVCLSCGGDDGLDLVVDLQTDLVAGTDFTGVRVEYSTEALSSGTTAVRMEEMLAVAGTDYTSGRRVAELRDVSRGPGFVLVRLFDGAGREVIGRLTAIDVRESFVLTVVITRSCLTVTCPGPTDPSDRTECAGGRCEAPGCSPETPERCASAGCSSDAECPGGSVPCVRGSCVDGACLTRADDALCAASEHCSTSSGCVPDTTVPNDASTCRPPPETNCDDGVDGDCDGQTDCVDNDCIGNACRMSGSLGQCRDNVCCIPLNDPPESNCDDGRDGDCDGEVDCADSDCNGRSCGATGTCMGGACCRPSPETNCTDGRDGDCDGRIDCRDTDCCAADNATCLGMTCPGGTCRMDGTCR